MAVAVTDGGHETTSLREKLEKRKKKSKKKDDQGEDEVKQRNLGKSPRSTHVDWDPVDAGERGVRVSERGGSVGGGLV